MIAKGRRIGIIAALPGELKPLVRGWDRLPAARGSGIAMWQRPLSAGDDEVVAVCAGMGAAAARRAFAAAEFLGAMDVVLSVGWAGALSDECRAGECYEVAEVIDSMTGERFSAGASGVKLVTTVQVADAAEKRRLAASYGARLVDMEAAAVARLAQMRGIPVRCFKGVSDEAGAELPDLNPFIDVDGQMKMAKFLGHVALRPGYWGSLVRLGGHSAVAAKSLADSVLRFLREVDPTSDGEAV
jgi:adenosylhomocysteine nucleosidase